MGDALLVEFHSVVDAERYAVEVQRSKAERNAGVPEAKRLVYRIGINLGDVIVEGDDIHGDGVNIADRLQELADPGGITISGTAYDQVKTKVEVGYAYLGEQRVKHVAEPVRVYRVLLDPTAAGKQSAPAAQGGGTGAGRRPRRHWRRHRCRRDRGLAAAVGTDHRSRGDRAHGTAAAGQAVDRGAAVRQYGRQRRRGLLRRRHHRGSDDRPVAVFPACS